MKKVMSLCVILIVFLCNGNLTLANTTPAVFLEEKQLSFDVHPIIRSGTTYLELRSFCTSLNFKLQWDQKNQTASCSKDSDKLAITLNKVSYKYNDNIVQFNAKPILINGRTMVPLREITERLGYKVIWLAVPNEILLLNTQVAYSSNEEAEDGDIKKQQLATDYLIRLQQAKRFNGTAFLAKEGTVILNQGYGYADEQTKRQNRPETSFAIASITKGITGIAILQLEEKGLLQLSDTVDNYLPELPYAKQMTIHQLLTHTAGLPWELTTSLAETKLIHEPGSNQRYSNVGYILLSQIIERTSGEHYASYVNNHIFSPSEMNHSGFDINTLPIQERAIGYSYEKDQLTIVNRDFSIRAGSGSLYSTVEDLYKLQNALYSDKILKKGSKDKMLSPHYGSWGYGWLVFPSNNGKLVQLSGSTTGFTSYIRSNERSKDVLILLSNHANKDLERIGKDIERIMN
ncbi:serine hydrolase [Anaerobacillus sp. MEB173]|uniref:serine hydrolase n=1 Tax=Anaerobacillus sp. MEB173 TaxID=3383345 RepID=UPI003F91E6BE